MKPGPSLVEPASSARAEPPTVHVALIYDALPAGQRAMQSCQRIADRMAGRVRVHTDLWKASVLALPEAREEARQNLAAADVIMVAGGDGAPLSDRLRGLLRVWAAGTDSARAPLLAYHTPAAETGDQWQALEFLAEIVRDARCDFIGHPPAPTVADSVPAGWRVAPAHGHALARWQPPATHPPTRWGIND
jgi:hypothetical protein